MPQGSSAVRPTNGLYLYLLQYIVTCFLHLWDQKPNICATINLIPTLHKTFNLCMKSKTTYGDECIIASDLFVV